MQQKSSGITRRHVLSIVVGVGVALTATLAPIKASAKSAEKLKFAHVYEVSHPLHQAALTAADQIKKATEGRVIIEVFPNSSLGKEEDINEGLSLGTVDIIYTGAGFAGTAYGPISMTDFPFTLRGLDHWRAYRNSDLFKKIAQGYKDATAGNEIAAISYYGSRHVTANFPILKPEDLKGLKIRVPNAAAYVLFPKAVGANPTPMAFDEVYLALQQGVVDAQENPLTTIKAKKFNEVQSNINLTAHIINSTLTVVSSQRLDQLDPVDSDAVRNALRETADWVNGRIEASESELVGWFRDQGTQVNEVDRGPFVEAVTPALNGSEMPFSPEDLATLRALPGNE